MAYDETKDKMIEERKIGDDFRVAIFRYSEGTPKIVIQRKTEFKDRNTNEMISTWTNKIGRLMKEEMLPIMEALQEMIVDKKLLDVDDKPKLDEVK